MEFCDMSVSEAIGFVEHLDLSETHRQIAAEIIKEIRGRLTFLANVGLDYLTLSRASATLSGGESQRIRLATQIGSGLVGVLPRSGRTPVSDCTRRTMKNCWRHFAG